jgi:hypothetical protein
MLADRPLADDPALDRGILRMTSGRLIATAW